MIQKIGKDRGLQIGDVLDDLENTFMLYGYGKLAAQIGLSYKDYKKLLDMGIKLTVSGKGKDAVIKVVSKTINREDIISALRSLNISHRQMIN